MTIEYVLLLFATLLIALNYFISAPINAFKLSGPRMAARVERHLETGGGFKKSNGSTNQWQE